MIVKNVIALTSNLLITVFLLASNGFCWEWRQNATLLAPTSSAVQRTQSDVQVESRRDVGISWQIATELSFASQLLPFRSGLGFGYRPSSESNGTQLTPKSVPIWVAFIFGTRDEDAWLNPYLGGRLGWIAPISDSHQWRSKPINAIAQISLGTIFKYGLGAEISYDYTSILKTFSTVETESRITSGRLALTLSWGIIFGTEHSYIQEDRIRDVDEEDQMRKD